MRELIEDYRITPGDHCGSASMRGLLDFYCGLELPEPVVFGLGVVVFVVASPFNFAFFHTTLAFPVLKLYVVRTVRVCTGNLATVVFGPSANFRFHLVANTTTLSSTSRTL